MAGLTWASKPLSTGHVPVPERRAMRSEQAFLGAFCRRRMQRVPGGGGERTQSQGVGIRGIPWAWLARCFQTKGLPFCMLRRRLVFGARAAFLLARRESHNQEPALNSPESNPCPKPYTHKPGQPKNEYPYTHPESSETARGSFEIDPPSLSDIREGQD